MALTRTQHSEARRWHRKLPPPDRLLRCTGAQDGNTVLHWCAHKGDPECMKLMLTYQKDGA
jgi:ankyrin repeat protein